MHYALCIMHYYIFADVAELADALVSGSSEAIHVGSSPVVRTKQKSTLVVLFLLGLRRDRPQDRLLVFALKTVINCFPNERHRPHQKSRINRIRLFLSKPQVWYIIECITRLWRDIHSYIISPMGCISSLARVYFPAV